MGETGNRILFGVIIAATVICALVFDFQHRILALGLILMFALLSVLEFYKVTDRGYEGRPLKNVGVVFSILLVLAFYAHYLHLLGVGGVQYSAPYQAFIKALYPGGSTAPIILLGLMMAALSVNLFWRPLDGTIYSVSTTVFGVLYGCLPFAFVFLYLSLKFAIFYLVYFALLAVMTDTGAYFSGRWFGKHNAGLKTSPKKTYEGYIGGVIFANLIAAGFLYGWARFAAHPAPIGYVEGAVLAFVASLVTIVGDLTESALKRDAKIKDSASIIPGHGGMLDLVDALLFVLPLGYMYLHYKAAYGFPV